ncbi:hypothetical protein BDW68DRAFT_178031 [Aspergillus falconensis]
MKNDASWYDEAGQHAPCHRQHEPGRYETRHASGDRPMSPHERINRRPGYEVYARDPGVFACHHLELARRMLLVMDDQEAREELYGEKPKSPTRVAAGLKAGVRFTSSEIRILLFFCLRLTWVAE